MKHLTKLLKWSCCVLLFTGLSACDSSLRKDLDELTGRVDKIESQIGSLNKSIEAMQDIIAKLQENVFIAKVEATDDGWHLTFTDNTSIDIKNGNGTSVIGVRQDSDGLYYWTLTGADGSFSWITDNDGEKLPVSVKPILSADSEGYWTISCDNGKTFSRILDSEGQPILADPTSAFFKDITYDEEYIHITLADGTVLDIPCRSNFYLLIKDAPETEEFEFGETKTYALESTGVERIVISKPDEWRVSVEGDVLTVTAPAAEHADCADMAGDVSLIYFSAGNLSSAVQLKVTVVPPKTIDIDITGTYIITNAMFEYPGEMAAIDATVTPSSDDFLYHVTQYRIGAYEEGEDTPEAVLNALIGALNQFIAMDGGWDAAEKTGLFYQGPRNHSSRYMKEGEDYRIAAFGIKKDTQNGKEVAVATTGVFLSDIIHTPTSMIDLSANGTSNCYIVSEPNTQYCFNATVMGNGKTTEGITPSAITPKKAFLAWDTDYTNDHNIIREVELTDDGYVKFTTGDNMDGNAMIVVTDGVPLEGLSLGTVLWSWHIWATDYTPDDDKKVINHDGKEFMMMDCNLGDWTAGRLSSATGYSSGEYWGLKYQWGRKDPFINVYAYSSYQHSKTYEEDYIWEQASMPYGLSAEETLQYAIQYPMVFFRGSYSTDNDWYGSSTGAGNRNHNLWGNADGQKAEKTIYDPCPAGYKVAPYESFSGFFPNGLEKSPVSYSELNVIGTYQNGWNFITSGEETSFFPAAGYITNTGSGSNVTRNGYYFASDALSTSSQARMLRIESFYVYLNSGDRSQGCSVRCVRE